MIEGTTYYVLSGSLRGNGFELPPIDNEKVARRLYAALADAGPLVVVKVINFVTTEWEAASIAADAAAMTEDKE